MNEKSRNWFARVEMLRITALAGGLATAIVGSQAGAQELEKGWKVREVIRREFTDFGPIRAHIDIATARQFSISTPANVAHFENRSGQPRCVVMYFAPPVFRYSPDMRYYGQGAVHYIKPGGTRRAAAWVYSRRPGTFEFGFGHMVVRSWVAHEKNRCSPDPRPAPKLKQRFIDFNPA